MFVYLQLVHVSERGVITLVVAVVVYSPSLVHYTYYSSEDVRSSAERLVAVTKGQIGAFELTRRHKTKTNIFKTVITDRELRAVQFMSHRFFVHIPHTMNTSGITCKHSI